MRRIVVRRSPVHGRGVFALTKIRSGELLVEYKGEVTSWRVASKRYQPNEAEDGHTFFFGLDDRYVIDGARGGNSARWLNHCCAPNCETEQEGRRVFVRALTDITAGEELFIDYLLDVKGRAHGGCQKAACLSMRRAALPRNDARPAVTQTRLSVLKQRSRHKPV